MKAPERSDAVPLTLAEMSIILQGMESSAMRGFQDIGSMVAFAELTKKIKTRMEALNAPPAPPTDPGPAPGDVLHI